VKHLVPLCRKSLYTGKQEDTVLEKWKGNPSVPLSGGVSSSGSSTLASFRGNLNDLESMSESVGEGSG